MMFGNVANCLIRQRRAIGLPTLTLVCVVASAGCYSTSDVEATSQTSLPVRSLESIRTWRGLTGRSILTLPAGDCPVLHYPPGEADHTGVNDLLAGDPTTDADNGFIYRPPVSSRWYVPPDDDEYLSTFNCCTYAVGDRLQLTTRDWIEPYASGATRYIVPFQVVIDSYYRDVKQWPSLEPDQLASLERDTDLAAGDVICFMDSNPRAPYVHVGLIVKHGDQNWMRSKFGTGPIIEATIAATAKHYAVQFDSIKVYRPK